jgi:hypothetical protein
MSKENRTIRTPVPITPNDGIDISSPCAGLHVNVGGKVKFTASSGSAVTLELLAGVSYPYEAKRIFATGTTAGGIHALYF